MRELTGPPRHFVVVGHRAEASPRFPLDGLPGSGGRIDILVRCIRAALLVADGIRRDTVLDLVLLGGDEAPVTLRFDGAAMQFARPDERAGAVLVRRCLVRHLGGETFSPVSPGVLAASVGLGEVLEDLPPAPLWVLDPAGRDVHGIGPGGGAFVIGDHRGLGAGDRSLLEARGAVPLGLGPVEVHTEDAITLVHNALDRARAAAGVTGPS